MLDFARAQPSHEDVFMDHYASLLKRAGQLVRGDVMRAEDLVHDAFVQFTLVRPTLADIQHVEAYLAGMLRNMHASAQRRAARRSETSLDPLDLDSLEEGWRSFGRTATLEARRDLELLCRYACQRRLSSKAGSVLILRFFHGYFPAEIARIAGMTARSVDEWIRVARREAKIFRDAPDHVSSFHPGYAASGEPAAGRSSGAGQAPFTPHLPDDPVAYAEALRAAIWRARTGECLAPRELARLYEADAVVSTETLAHLVSCRPCLERVNTLLGFASLDDRFPHDMAGAQGSGGSAPRRRDQLDRARSRAHRRARVVFEHRVQQLVVAVNGFPLSTTSVTRPSTEQRLSFNIDEVVRFVEIFSGAGLRLLFVLIDEPSDGAVEQGGAVALADGRHLRVRIDFSQAWPELELFYEDPEQPVSTSADVRVHRLDEPAVAAAPGFPVPDDGWLDRNGGAQVDMPRRVSPRGSGLRAFALHWRGLGGLTLRGFGIRGLGRRGVRPRRWLIACTAVVLVASLLVFDSPKVWAAALQRAIVEAAASVTRVLEDWGWRSGSRATPRVPVLPQALPPAGAALPGRLLGPPAPPAARSTRAAPRPLTPAALVNLEVEVLARLDRVGALMGEQLTVARTGSGLRVEGLVESAGRRAEIREALAPLVATASDALTVAVETLDAAVRRQRIHRVSGRRGEPAVRQYVFASGDAPGIRLLRERLASASVRDKASSRDAVPAGDAAASGADALEARVQEVVERVLQASRQALLHSLALEGLIDRVDASRAALLTESARETWWQLLRRHAGEAGEQTARLAAALAPLASSTASPPPASRTRADRENQPGQANSRNHPDQPNQANQADRGDDLQRMVRRLVERVSEHDGLARMLFAASAETTSSPSSSTSSTSLSIDPDVLLQSLPEAQRLARAIASLPASPSSP